MTRRKLLVGCAMEMVVGKQPPASTLYLAQSSLAYNRVLHQALARSLRETKVQFVVGPSESELADQTAD